MNLSTWLMTLVGVLLGVGVGVVLHIGWVRRHAERKLRLPDRWLLNARGLVTSEEMDVWKWLRLAFPDHAVMVKVPVMRFTVPSTRDKPENKDQHWHELLNGVYCSFTVSTLDGKVVGCVDVPGKRGLTKAQRDMKESLLMECGIGYTTVRSNSLPSASAMRTAFLGEAEIVEQEAEETRGGDSSFHAALTEFTSEKVRAAKAAAIQELKDKQAATTEARGKNANVGFNPDGTGSFMTKDKPDRFATKWEDSFTMGESRPAKLS
ncbi:MAG: DUF2726 domain-containing protein [Polaromonas sp.]|uniref:DUF2726 domain-containing protein n=1 Tax=Polaromonas sp. TaxID=1869339 RepID=UPI00403645DA|nr:DUF2726 domain-containing protein [Polaromonas sp.]